MVTVSIMLATIMQTLDTTIANVALPHMAGGLSASEDEITWVLTSYIVAAAIATPVTGWLSGRYGRKAIFLVSIAGFTVSSVMCGISGNLLEIVIARLFQGVFGASLVPLSQAVLLDINPPERHARAMAVWGMGVMLGPILGPTLGGWLTDNASWRWVFFINLPIGILSLLGVYYYVHEPVTKFLSRFDWFGFSMLAIAIGMLQLFLDRGQQLDWWSSIEIRVEIVCTVMAFTFFVLHSISVGEGSFLNMKLLHDRNFVTGLVFYFLLGLLLYATRALLPPLLETLLGYPVMLTGLVTAPTGVGTMLAMMVAGRLVGRIDSRYIVASGFGLTALSLWAMAAYTPQITEWDVVWPGIVQGVGLGLIYVPLTTMTFSTLARSLRSEGTAIFSLLRNIGSSIGISVMQTLFSRNTIIVHSSLAAYITAGAVATRPDALSRAFDLTTKTGLAALDAVLNAQAQFIGYIDDFWLMFWMTLLAMPFLWLMRERKAAGTDAAGLDNVASVEV
ncbi:MAG: DHA2 family efflux MFS transporter permease subunit [Burkholderiaceae bacterium]|nr:MAG: DHA2 family efflux MFS transporter permease subunit [Burkholderiaceae bacterium]